MRYQSREQFKRTSIKTVTFLGVIAILFATFWAVGIQRVFAADNVISVTTVTDEDADPGTGCSLYEATIAASTNAPYGGCTAGSATDHDVIYLPAGVYTKDDDNGPLAGSDTRLVLDDVSLRGDGVDQTSLENYWIALTGDGLASLEGLTSRSTIYHPTYVSIAGSNKTILDVVLDIDVMAPIDIRLEAMDGDVNNTIIENVAIIGRSGPGSPTNPATNISCMGSNSCSDVIFRNVDFAAYSNISLSLSGVDGVEIYDSELESLSCGSSVNIYTKEDAIIDGLSVYTNSSESCSNPITLMSDSAARVENILLDGGGITIGVNTPVVNGLTVNSTSTVNVNNEYDGSSLTDVDITGVDVNVGSSGFPAGLMASKIDGLNIDGSMTLSFKNQKDGALLSDLSLYAEDTSNTELVSIYGDDVTIDGINMRIDDHSHASLDIYGSGVTVKNAALVNAMINLQGEGDYTIENFTIDAPDELEAVYVYRAGSEGVIRNGYIHNGRGGISGYGSDSEATSLIIDNVQFENLSGSSGVGAIGLYAFEAAIIRNVTINRVNADAGRAIYISGGTGHKVSNVTIFDSHGGFYFTNEGTQSGDTEVTLNNVTVHNTFLYDVDNDGDDYELGVYNSFPVSRSVNVLVNNSYIGGPADHTSCSISSGSSLVVNSSFANDSSCADEGFDTVFVPGFDTALADNDNNAATLGALGQERVLQTIALTGSSPLLKAGDTATCEATDARGVTRSESVGCDVGAYQLSVATPPIDDNGGDDDEGNDSGDNGGNDDNGDNGDNDSDSDGDNGNSGTGNNNSGNSGGNTGDNKTGANNESSNQGKNSSSIVANGVIATENQNAEADQPENNKDNSTAQPAESTNSNDGGRVSSDDSSKTSTDEDSGSGSLVTGIIITASVLGLALILFAVWRRRRNGENL